MLRHQILMAWAIFATTAAAGESCPVVDTGQVVCYDATKPIRHPQAGQAFFGQDAHYAGLQPSYRDNGDGTISDLNTGLMWQQDPGEKTTLAKALIDVKRCRLGGYDDWRVPAIKELYSLILFSGYDPDPQSARTEDLKPFIDTRYFRFSYGTGTETDRIIDSQYLSATKYVSTTMFGNETLFGVNFADGRIKGYPLERPGRRGAKLFYCLYVRGNPEYGINQFVDNKDGTVTDKATGLMWMKVDSGALKAGDKKQGGMNWEQALAWAENLEYAGYTDWRLPTAKELQGIVDYTRSPDTTQSAAIDPVFQITSITNEGGKKDFPFFWTGTTHASLRGGNSACYVVFGRALGWMQKPRTKAHELLDVHGAGAQRSDPKTGDPAKFPKGRGPQGDVIRIDNFVRCVRGGEAKAVTQGPGLPMTQQRQSGRPSFVERLDKNGDGKVSPGEFDGPKHHFSKLDRDGDGYLSEEEAPSGPPRGRR